MAGPILQVEQVGKHFGGFVALENIDLSVNAGERLGLIGPQFQRRGLADDGVLAVLLAGRLVDGEHPDIV